MNYFSNKSPNRRHSINVLCLVGILCIPIATFVRCVECNYDCGKDFLIESVEV